MVEKIGEGIEYRRRTDGFTLVVDNSSFRIPDMVIHMSDDAFETLLLVHQRYTQLGDPSLTAGDLNRIDDYGYGQGGEV